MNVKQILVLGAIALIGFGMPTAYAGHRHHHHHSSISIGFGFGFPYGGYGYYPYNYYGYSPYGYSYGYYPYNYYPYGSTYTSYPYSYGYSSYRPVYRGQVAQRGGSVVVQVQEKLARAGYYHGRVDGVMGSQTRAGIRAYQRAHGQRVDGVINDQLLSTMGMRYSR
jgi:His-Xaa-Ser repeat protein HxsA